MRQSHYNRLDMGFILETEVFGIEALLATNSEGRTSNSQLLTSINPIFVLKWANLQLVIPTILTSLNLDKTKVYMNFH